MYTLLNVNGNSKLTQPERIQITCFACSSLCEVRNRTFDARFVLKWLVECVCVCMCSWIFVQLNFAWIVLQQIKKVFCMLDFTDYVSEKGTHEKRVSGNISDTIKNCQYFRSSAIFNHSASLDYVGVNWFQMVFTAFVFILFVVCVLIEDLILQSIELILFSVCVCANNLPTRQPVFHWRWFPSNSNIYI